MSFDPNDPRITAYVFDELDDPQRAAFQSELDQSQELRDTVQQTRVALEQLSSELRSEPPVVMSDAQRTAVAQEIQRVSADEAKPQPTVNASLASGDTHPGRKWAALAVLAASVLFVVGLAYMYQVQEHNRRAVVMQSESDREQSARSASNSVIAPTPGGGTVRVAIEPPNNASPTAGGQGSRKGYANTVPNQPKPADTASLAPRTEPAMDVDDSRPTTTEYSTEAKRGTAEVARELAKNRAATNANKGQVVNRMAGHSRGTSVVPAAAAPAPADAYGESMGIGGYAPPAPSASAPGQLAAGSGDGGGMGGMGGYGSEYGGYAGGADGMGMGGMGGYGGGMEGQDGYARGYGMDSGYGPGVTPGHAMDRPDVYSPHPDGGSGPGASGDRYDRIVENPFLSVRDHSLSTFSIDVDTASYSKVRMFLMQNHSMPRPDAVRIEELVNYFGYDYQPPQDDAPFAAHIEVADCPWTPEHRLVRFGIKGQEMDRDERPSTNLVFLLDVSGSMKSQNKLPLVKQGMKMLVDQLGENDRVAIAVYAGAAGLVLDSTTGDHKQVILDSLDRLHAGGSTNGGDGIRLAYQTALDNFIGGGVNRVILCTDGDFNVGTTGNDELVRLAEENAKSGVFLSVLGFGMGNHNDSMLEQVSNKGNGTYAFIDNESEARKVLVEEMTGTLVTIAKDVKIQVEFNPAEVSAYRLIGYENRILAAEDFNDDTKDAGEIGAGHTVTALYEVVPAVGEASVATAPVDDLRYQSSTKLTKVAKTGELLTLKMRYKQPDGDSSELLEFPVKDAGHKFGQATQDFRFAASVAAFGMLLRDSQYRGNVTYAGVLETATEAASGDTSGYRAEFLKMIERAKQLSGQ